MDVKGENRSCFIIDSVCTVGIGVLGIDKGRQSICNEGS